MITLSELRKFGKPGGALEDMQLLKMSRLSVSKVSKAEWDFITGLVDVAEASAKHQPTMTTTTAAMNGEGVATIGDSANAGADAQKSEVVGGGK